MSRFEPHTDDYIEKAADFARPVLAHIRELVHRVCPDIEEKMKWGHVHFDYKGPVCYMAAFKQHCNFGFWKTSLMPDPESLFKGSEEESKLNGLKTIADLPPDDVLIEYISNAILLNEQGKKVVKAKTKAENAEIETPDYFKAALSKNANAQKHFDAFSNSKRKEYIQWLEEAKTEATRQKRLDTAMEWIAEGKSRNWKYQ